MTGNRYFYTDPLAAAWMQTTYGMKAADEAGNILEWRGYKGQWAWRAIGVVGTPTYTGAIHIHPDSLHLLEPQVGDAVEVHGCFYGTVWRLDGGQLLWNETSLNNPPEEERHYENLDRCEAQDIDRIIQRNGKPFHWPETES